MLTNSEIDDVVYTCRQAGDDSTYATSRAIIAAYRAKLRQGVELPEPAIYADNGVEGYTQDQLQQYGDQRDQAGYLRGLEDAKRVCEDSPERETATGEWVADQAACAAAIEKLKGGE